MIATRSSGTALLLLTVFAVTGHVGAVAVGMAGAWVAYTIIVMIVMERRWRRKVAAR